MASRSAYSLQVSHGYLKSPDAIKPDAKLHRTTASLIYNQPLGRDSSWSTSLVWGQNNFTIEGKSESALIETNYQRGRHTFYGRFERVEKSGHELVLARRDRNRTFPIYAYSVGYVRELAHGQGIDIGVGGQLTIDSMPGYLDRDYGDETPVTFELFLRVRPSLHNYH